jgi:hypothetical protein
MSPEQALEILKQVSALAPLTLQGHIQAQEAYILLKKLLEEKKDA